MMKRFLILLAILFLASLPQIAKTQWAVGPHIVVSFPSQDFENVSGTGGGFGVKVLRKTNALAGGLALRGDFAFLTFGRETTFARDFAGFLIPVETRNEGFRLTFGPQYKVGSRSLKLYAGANGGLYFFRTNRVAQTSFQVISDSDDNNFALGWNVGGGLQYDIGLGPWLDLSVEYQTMYNLPAADLEQTEEGSELQSLGDITANEITLKIGIIFFLGR